MKKVCLICLMALLVALPFLGCGGSESPVDMSDINYQTAVEFVKNSATFQYDSIPETLVLTNSSQTVVGMQYIFEFDCRHPGYGDRTGQLLAQVITHHAVLINVNKEQVISAVMDGHWDMVHQLDINPRGT